MGKRSTKIILRILIYVGFILSISGSYYYYNLTEEKISQINDKKTDNINTLISKNTILMEKMNELEDVENKISFLNNIDKETEELKNKYFNYIKELEKKIRNGESNKKIAYLTFDDGPYYNTYKVLDILDEYNVKATFFTISANGQYCYDNKSKNCYPLYKEYIKRGHTIANHTYTHAIRRGLYSSVNSFMDAINKQENWIKEQTGGYVTNITRFPGGSSSSGKLKQPIIEALRKKGYGWVDWTAGDGDGGGLKTVEQAWNNLTPTINSKIEVILFHDYSRVTTKILPDVIKYLRNNGYELYPLFYDSVMINK